MTLVDVNRLYPGDVLLSTTRAMSSALIRSMTFSEYSHASLHLGAGVIIQSTSDEGVAFATLELVKAESNARLGVSRVWGRLPGATVLHVYRHESLTNLQLSFEQQDPLRTWLNEYVMTSYWGKDYARLATLASASPFLSFAPKAKTAVLNAVGRLGADVGKVAPGPFCSQLVAEVLSAAGIPAVPVDLPSHGISPQTLVDPSHTNLRRALTESAVDDSIPNDNERLESRRRVLQSSVVTALNAYRRGQEHAKVRLEEVDSLLKERSRV
jgi:hypothetical protein